ncbi:hypothetical protein Omen_090 [Erwinia phage Omen]|uniref:Uncharacterized protein n=1 Tax=Erwinia phage Harbringer TaxID=3158978 RepID=A0AAU8EH48_9CAUD
MLLLTIIFPLLWILLCERGTERKCSLLIYVLNISLCGGMMPDFLKLKVVTEKISLRRGLSIGLDVCAVFIQLVTVTLQAYT